jgi:nucleoside-diphosphate-sugar epimerase
MAKVIKDIESTVSGRDLVLENLRADDHTHLVFVDDAAQATVLAATVDGPLSLVYNVAGLPEDHVTLGQIAETIKKIEPAAGSVTFNGTGPHRGFFMDITRARRELGYDPEYTMETGLRESVAYFRAASD